MSAHIKTLIKYIFLWSLLTADDSVGSLAFKKKARASLCDEKWWRHRKHVTSYVSI